MDHCYLSYYPNVSTNYTVIIMTTKSTKQSEIKAVPFFQAQQAWINLIDRYLTELETPLAKNSAPEKTRIRGLMKDVLKEAIENTQRQLLLNNSGNNKGIIQADAVGFTTATSNYDQSTFKQGKLVNVICKEILKEQEEDAVKQGMPVSQANILKAQQDANDVTKTTIDLESVTDSDGNQTKLSIDKETGDTTIFEKDKKTGIWKKIGNTAKGFWEDTKNFCKNIWNWCSKQCKRFWNWITSIFKSPEEQDVIRKAA